MASCDRRERGRELSMSVVWCVVRYGSRAIVYKEVTVRSSSSSSRMINSSSEYISESEWMNRSLKYKHWVSERWKINITISRI